MSHKILYFSIAYIAQESNVLIVLFFIISTIRFEISLSTYKEIILRMSLCNL